MGSRTAPWKPWSGDVAAGVSWWWWVGMGADELRFDKRGYGAGRIVVSLLVHNLPGSSGTMIETTRVDAQSRRRRRELVVMGAPGS